MITKTIISIFILVILFSCSNNLEGNYINQDNGLYQSIDFKGKTSVVVTDGIIGQPFATSYEMDGKIIRIKTDKSDLMFTIKDSKTIVGEGFAEGTYVKTE